jgi:hypothetical protein
MEDQNKKDLMNIGGQGTQVYRVDIEQLFSGDSYGLFVFKKTERIVTAIYMLTGLMSDKEPMREKLRALATEMLSNALGMSERVWGEETFQKNLLGSLSEISVLFDIAETAKMISKMNHQIISRELKNITDFLITSSSNYSSAKIAFPKDMFDGNYNYIPEQTYQTKLPEAQTDLSIEDQLTTLDESLKDIKDSQKSKEENKKSFTKISNSTTPIKDKNNRQDIILSMLEKGAKLTIKDFAKNIKDCSEKTIQRELIVLVSKGIIKKEGERRWSKYFLA